MAGVFRISQTFQTRASPSDGLVLYSGCSLVGKYNFYAEMKSVYTKTLADWAWNVHCILLEASLYLYHCSDYSSALSAEKYDPTPQKEPNLVCE